MATSTQKTPAQAIVSILNVTPSDTAEVKSSPPTNGQDQLPPAYPTNLLIAEPKAIAIVDLFDNTIVFPANGLVVGVFHRIAFKKVLSTGTDGTFTAGAIKAGWDS